MIIFKITCIFPGWKRALACMPKSHYVPTQLCCPRPRPRRRRRRHSVILLCNSAHYTQSLVATPHSWRTTNIYIILYIPKLKRTSIYAPYAATEVASKRSVFAYWHRSYVWRKSESNGSDEHCFSRCLRALLRRILLCFCCCCCCWSEAHFQAPLPCKRYWLTANGTTHQQICSMQQVPNTSVSLCWTGPRCDQMTSFQCLLCMFCVYVHRNGWHDMMGFWAYCYYRASVACGVARLCYMRLHNRQQNTINCTFERCSAWDSRMMSVLCLWQGIDMMDMWIPSERVFLLCMHKEWYNDFRIFTREVCTWFKWGTHDRAMKTCVVRMRQPNDKMGGRLGFVFDLATCVPRQGVFIIKTYDSEIRRCSQRTELMIDWKLMAVIQ